MYQIRLFIRQIVYSLANRGIYVIIVDSLGGWLIRVYRHYNLNGSACVIYVVT